jgi:hypothetical protein
MPTHADTEWEVMPNQISLKWMMNIGTNGEGWMVKSEGQNPSLLIPRSDVETWEDFKRFVTEGHELDRKWQVPKAMIGRRLSQPEAKRLLAKLR